MRSRWMLFLVASLSSVAALFTAISFRSVQKTQAQSTVQSTVLPASLTLESAPASRASHVIWRKGSTEHIVGTVIHESSSARKGTLFRKTASGFDVLVVAKSEGAKDEKGYSSSLFFVSENKTKQVVTGLADASKALVTRNGTILIERGQAGKDPTETHPEGGVFRERVDNLAIDSFDPTTGMVRTIWSGQGQTAFLATPMRGDEALIYWVHEQGASLFALNARLGTTRTVLSQMHPLARDFTFDQSRNEIVFARAASQGSQLYEIAATSAVSEKTPYVRYRAASNHLMPFALHDGSIAFSRENSKGLALLPSNGQSVQEVSPFGLGSYAVLDEQKSGAWLAVRHTENATQQTSLVNRENRSQWRVGSSNEVIEWIAFAEEAQ